MSDLISKKVVVNEIENTVNGFCDDLGRIIQMHLTGIEDRLELRPHKGKWIKKETERYIYYDCSQCKGALTWKGRYCPYCGSEMETEL